jgi:hypothetical protein
MLHPDRTALSEFFLWFMTVYMLLLHHIDFCILTVVLEAISSKLCHLKDKIVTYCSILMGKGEKRIKWMKDEGMKGIIPY